MDKGDVYKMGTYNLSCDEIIDSFENWLQETSLGEGDIGADVIAEAWNKLAKKYEWNEYLNVIENE